MATASFDSRSIRFWSSAATLAIAVGALFGCVRSPQHPLGSASDQSARDFVPRQPQEWTLPNGLTVLFLRDRELPTVSGTLYLRAGILWEEAPASITVMATQLRDGGTTTLKPQDLDERLQELGAKISSGAAPEQSSVSFFSLASDLDEVFTLFADVVRRPGFDESRLRLWQTRQLDSIKRRRDDPSTVLELSLRELTFGSAGPYGRVVTSSDIQRLSVPMMRREFQKVVRPDGAILAVSGDIEPETLRRIVDRELGDWLGRGTPLPPPPPVPDSAAPGIYYVKMPFEQASVGASQQGIPLHTPDEFDIRLFNRIYGDGSFGSLLMQQVRADEGLAYSVVGMVLPNFVQGQNILRLQTRADATAKALGLTLDVLQKLRSEPVTPELLHSHQQSLMNSQVFKFASDEAQVNRKAVLRLLGYPEDFDVHYMQRIEAVTPEGVQQVAINRWKLDDLRVVVIGNETACRALLAAVPAPFAGYPRYRAGFEERLIPSAGPVTEGEDLCS